MRMLTYGVPCHCRVVVVSQHLPAAQLQAGHQPQMGQDCWVCLRADQQKKHMGCKTDSSMPSVTSVTLSLMIPIHTLCHMLQHGVG